MSQQWPRVNANLLLCVECSERDGSASFEAMDEAGVAGAEERFVTWKRRDAATVSTAESLQAIRKDIRR